MRTLSMRQGFLFTLIFMKKIIRIVVVVLLLAGGFLAWILLGSGTAFQQKEAFLYIPSNAATKEAVMDSIRVNNLVSNPAAFDQLASRMGYWNRIRPGRYRIEKGASILTIVRMLRNGQQAAVNLVINKLRTKEDLAALVGNKFETDSSSMMTFLNSETELQSFDANPATAMWNIVPDTYTFFWSTSPKEIYEKIVKERREFWTPDRREKASKIGLTPVEVVTLASIVEEETTKHSEKDTIASVYLNRLRVGMPLQADPTLKFAARDFSLKVIRGSILDISSPYNTYRNKGLPPGPICTPSKTTLEKVLNPADRKSVV